MRYKIMFFLFNLFVIMHRLVHAFNETCIQNKTECTEPLQCIGGFCHCSHTGESTTTSPLSFWTGSDCAPCPAGYVALDENCYKLSVQKDDEMNWIRARSRCQESGGDLLVIRSAKDFGLFKFWVGRKIQQEQMHQRTPRNATYFASVWLGAKLVDWTGDGTYQLVTPGPVLNKNSFYWCGHSSPLDQEPNYTGLKKTGERQECVGLAVFPDGTVCMHDWFCSWDSYVLCEIYRPSQQNTSIEAQEEGEQSNDLITYGVIGGGILVLILISVGIYCTCCKKKNIDSSDSTESAVSTASEL